MHKEFYIGKTGTEDLALEEWKPYFDADNILNRNLNKFNCKVPPIVIELTFYNLWTWDMPDLIRRILPELKPAVLLKKSKAWNCVWLTKTTLPDCDRSFCELIFFGNKDIIPESPDFRKTMLNLMHQYEEITGYNILGMPFDSSIHHWVRSFCSVNGRFTIFDCGEINPD